MPSCLLLAKELATPSLRINKSLPYWVHGTFADETHYDNVIMGAMASQITSLTIVYSTVYSDADQRKYQSSASLAFVWGIHRGPVDSPHKWPVTRKRSPFDDVIVCLGFQWKMKWLWYSLISNKKCFDSPLTFLCPISSVGNFLYSSP